VDTVFYLQSDVFVSKMELRVLRSEAKRCKEGGVPNVHIGVPLTVSPQLDGARVVVFRGTVGKGLLGAWIRASETSNTWIASVLVADLDEWLSGLELSGGGQ